MNSEHISSMPNIDYQFKSTFSMRFLSMKSLGRTIASLDPNRIPCALRPGRNTRFFSMTPTNKWPKQAQIFENYQVKYITQRLRGAGDTDAWKIMMQNPRVSAEPIVRSKDFLSKLKYRHDLLEITDIDIA